jgi:hypothetical protein
MGLCKAGAVVRVARSRLVDQGEAVATRQLLPRGQDQAEHEEIDGAVVVFPLWRGRLVAWPCRRVGRCITRLRLGRLLFGVCLRDLGESALAPFAVATIPDGDDHGIDSPDSVGREMEEDHEKISFSAS